MATPLRSSSLARLSHRLNRHTSPSPSALRQSVACRAFATKKNGSDKASKDDKPKTPGRPAPGFERMFDGSNPISKPHARTPGKGVKGLSKEDEESLDKLAEEMMQSMPKNLRDPFTKGLDIMKQEGPPEEVKELIKDWQKEGRLNLTSAAKMVRIANRLTRRGAAPSGDEPQIKAEAHDPGPAEESKTGQKQRAEDKPDPEAGQSGGKKDNETFPGGIRLDPMTILTTTVLSYLTYRQLFPAENSRNITWQEFRTQFLDRGLVEKLTVINRKLVKVSLNREAASSVYPDSPAAQGAMYYFTIGDVGSLERHLDEAQKELGIPGPQRLPVAFTEQTPWFQTLLSFAPTFILLGGGYYLLRRSAASSGGAGGIFGVGRSRAKRFNHETDVKVTFKDVAGMEEAKLEIMEFVSFLREPGMYKKLGAKIPRGAILSGPPGTGKTLLAKAVAGESKVPFFSVTGSEFVEMFVGVGASRVRDLFTNARKNSPSIIFIDEIDAIGKSRGKSFNGGSDEREATLNQILTEMDGFNTTEQVVVLAGTNRADVLDAALMRPGRFDRHINIDKPTMAGRKEIFEVHLRKIVTNEEPTFLQGRLAAMTPGFAGADIANCVNEAALIDSVVMKDFESAIERVIGGLEKKSLVLNKNEKRVVAFHEAGHAICGWYFKYADPLLKVSIIPRGQGLGYAQYLPDGDSFLMSVNQLMDRMAMTLGGRVSEELHFETVTSGASDDFNKVTRMATMMVTKFGMSSKVGTLFYEDNPAQQMHKPFSEETAKNIDSEVRRIVDEAYKQCKDLLIEKKKEVGIVAEELLQKEMLSRDDMIRLLGPRPFESSGEFEKYFGARGDSAVPGAIPAPTDAPAAPAAEDAGDGPPGPALGLGGGVGPAPTIFSADRR